MTIRVPLTSAGAESKRSSILQLTANFTTLVLTQLPFIGYLDDSLFMVRLRLDIARTPLYPQARNHNFFPDLTALPRPAWNSTTNSPLPLD